MPTKYLEKILKARVYDVAIETPLDVMRALSARLDNHVLLKREDLQPVFSFKLRGAYNKIVHLSAAQRAKGVIAASAGNHAQGVARAASRLGIQSLIVMPRTTPDIKVLSVRKLGGKAVLHGDTYDEAYGRAVSLADEKGMVFVHPYDDPEVIAGQGTVAMEILRQHEAPLHAIFVPVGGGGLIAGVSAYVKALYPEVKVIGVEPEDAPTLQRALQRKKRVILDQVGIFADGVAVRRIGAEPFRVARKCVDEVVLVSTDEICAAIKDIFDDTRSIAEPAGALAVAGMKRYVERTGIRGDHMVGGRAAGIADEVIYRCEFPERPGALLRFLTSMGQRWNISLFHYRNHGAAYGRVLVSIQVPLGDRRRFEGFLGELAYPYVEETGNPAYSLFLR